jgi:hypothetical protein
MFILLLPLAAAAGAGIYELLRPAPKTALVLYTQNSKLVDQIDIALQKANIDHEVLTDGISGWIQVKEADRGRAVQMVQAALKGQPTG